MGTQSNPPERDGEERRPASTGGLRLRTTCRARYGRATLTIRRWGGLDELVGKSDVAKRVNAFRAGQTTAEDVAWAFVRARIETHSPTFRWQGASLDRLIQLVTRCSDEPHLAATTPADLAKELVKARDEQAELVTRMSKQFSEMFDGVSQLQALSPQLTVWAAQNQRTFADLHRTMSGLSQSLVGPRVINPFASLTTAMRHTMFPVLQPPTFQAIALAGLPTTLDQLRIRLPDAAFGDLTKSLSQSLALYGGAGTRTVPPALSRLTQQQSVKVADVFAATQEAAELADREGNSAEAAELRAMRDEAAEIVANPSTERLEQMVEELSERFDEFSTKYERDQKNAVSLELFLWFLGIYLALFLYLLDQLALT